MRTLAFRRAMPLAMILGAISACSMFDTNVTNPNAIEENALGDAASAPTLANGRLAQHASTIKAITTKRGRTIDTIVSSSINGWAARKRAVL